MDLSDIWGGLLFGRSTGSGSYNVHVDPIMTVYQDFSHLFDQVRHGLRQPLQKSMTVSLTCVLYVRRLVNCFGRNEMTRRLKVTPPPFHLPAF